MKKSAMALFLLIVVTLTSGCASQRGWATFEEQTRVASAFGGPFAIVGGVAKVGRLVSGMMSCHDCNQPVPEESSPPGDEHKE